ncbi:uncharacterized protein L203_105750 [Cryptococcus depauperatus CBS 7841]|uniref:Uncharacterized protein n=1 Tax=Cryptococcus depauperatus CBS 7841 TaxID=1295531 RepID=A0A1E3IFI1_9TREE|nr:hypothetical protein L203_03626 [Cryptococcus depauperatus CBS 7841]
MVRQEGQSTYLPNPHSFLVPQVEAVPSPIPKVAYAPPVFQTFQDRKRERDMVLRANSNHVNLSEPSSSPYPVFAQVYRSPSPLPIPPSPSTVAMMAPPRLASGALPTPPGSSGIYMPPSASPSFSSSRPLPPPRTRTPLSVTTSESSSSTCTFSSPHTSSQSVQTPTTAPLSAQAELDRSDTISSVKSLDRNCFNTPSKRPLPKPPGKINPSKSLDRGISSGLVMEDKVQKNNRKQPYTVREESEEEFDQEFQSMDLGDAFLSSVCSAPWTPVRPQSPQVPIIVAPSNNGQPSSPLDLQFPAKFTSIPVSDVSDSDSSLIASVGDDSKDGSDVTPKAKRKPADPSSPGIQISGAPIITVSSSNTADEPEQGGEISFVVPTISISPEKPQTVHTPSASMTSQSPAQPSHTRIHPGSAILCTGCSNPIIGRIVNAMNQRWHPQCFMCAECGELLEHVSSFEFEGKAYCHLDYHDKFANRCFHCKTPIVESRFITLNDDILGQRYYHELHFFCSECGDPFLDPSKSSAPGTEKERGGAEEEDGETNDFVIHKGHPYCESCHLRLHKPKCKACAKPIPDIAINAMGAKWHKECFVCVQCHGDFGNSLFFPKDGKAFCTTCYEDFVLLNRQ